MDKKDLTDQLSRLEEKARRQRGLEARARVKAEKHERRIAELRRRHGMETPPAELATTGEARPSGVAAIRELLRENPSRIWSAGEIYSQLEQRAWVSRSAQHRLQGTEAAISRLVRGGEVLRVRRGLYAVAAPRHLDAPHSGLGFQPPSTDTATK